MAIDRLQLGTPHPASECRVQGLLLVLWQFPADTSHEATGDAVSARILVFGTLVWLNLGYLHLRNELTDESFWFLSLPLNLSLSVYMSFK